MKEEKKISLVVDEHNLDVRCSYRLDAEEVIFFIHGIGDTKEDYDAVWEMDEFNKYSILTFDCIGFGMSSKPENFSYTIESHAQVALQLLDKLECRKIHIVAHSVGGAIGLMLTELLHPDSVKSFINIEGNLIGADCGIVTRRTIAASFEEYREKQYPLRSARLLETRGSSYANETMLPLAFYKTAQSVVKLSDSGKLLEIFKKLKSPKLYMYGEENKEIPVIKELADIPTAEILGAGHRPMDDNPAMFYKRIIEFLV